MTSTDPTAHARASTPAGMAAIDRRTLLRGLALLGAGAVVSACGGAAVSESSSAAASPSAGSGDPGGAAVNAVAPDAEVSLAVVAATFEQLADEPNPFVFGLFTLEQAPVEDVAAQVYAVPSGGGEPLGPWAASWAGGSAGSGAAGGGAVPAADGEADAAAATSEAGTAGHGTDALRSLYVAAAEFAATGLYEVVVVTDDGRAGTVAVDVRDRESSQLPAPGEQATAVPTPTVDDQLGYETLCTRTPEPCGMHGESLETALTADRPIVLLFATPAFCQTAVCGPTVDVVEQVRLDVGDDVAFIHCEIFSDAGATVGDPVAAWRLPTEPWMFVIDADGGIVRRADGPLLVLADEVRSLIDSGLNA